MDETREVKIEAVAEPGDPRWHAGRWHGALTVSGERVWRSPRTYASVQHAIDAAESCAVFYLGRLFCGDFDGVG